MQNIKITKIPAPVGSWFIKPGQKFQAAAVLFATIKIRKEASHA